MPQQQSSTSFNSTIRGSLLDKPSNLVGVFLHLTLIPNNKIKTFITYLFSLQLQLQNNKQRFHKLKIPWRKGTRVGKIPTSIQRT